MRAQIVGVVVARAEHISAEYDTALHFVAEALTAALGEKGQRVFRLFTAVAVAHAIETGEIGGGFSCGYDIVNRHSQLRVRQGDVDNLAALALIPIDSIFDIGFDLGVDALTEELLRDAELPGALRLFQRGSVVRLALWGDRSRVEIVLTQHGLHKERGVFDRAGERTYLIERGCEGNQSVAGNESVGGLHTNHTTERSGLSNGAARVRTKGSDGLPCRQGGRTPSRGTARDGFEVPGIGRGLVSGILGRRAHGELVHVEATPDNRARLTELGNTRGVVGRDVVFQHLGSATQRLVFNCERVFDPDGNAVERAEAFARSTACVGGFGLSERVVSVGGKEGFNSVVDRCSPVNHRLGDSHRCSIACFQHGGQFSNGFEMKIGHW